MEILPYPLEVVYEGTTIPSPWIEPGVVYKTVPYSLNDAERGDVFLLKEDQDGLILCRESGCAHLKGGDWTVLKRISKNASIARVLGLI